MKLDRQLQYEILNILSEAYPSATTQVMNRVIELADEDKIIANLVYLESHGLLTSGLSNYSGGDPIINSALLAITHRGMDFLVDDGGLSAILGTVTVKLHADTVKDLLAIEINHADLTPEDKNILGSASSAACRVHQTPCKYTRCRGRQGGASERPTGGSMAANMDGISLICLNSIGGMASARINQKRSS